MKKIVRAFLPDELGHAIHCRLHGLGLPYENIYHCCTWKSASQWFVTLFSHPHVLEYSRMGVVTAGNWCSTLRERGLIAFERPDEFRDLLSVRIGEEFSYPSKTIATTLYYSYDEFKNLPTLHPYRAFFMMRDPRDLLVSWYFSMRDSHKEEPWVTDVRRYLRQNSKDDGLHFAIDFCQESDLFNILRSWQKILLEPKKEIRVFRYEDLSRDHAQFIQNLFLWLDLRLPEEKVAEVIYDTSFSSLSGRCKGNENTHSHLRKGISGDWENHLKSEHISHLNDVSGNLIELLGYK